MTSILVAIIIGFNYFVGIYYGVVNIFYSVLLAISFFVILRYTKRLRYSASKDFLTSPETPPVSVIIAAYNEENVIFRTVKSALSMNYPSFEVIVVNDGSDDGTLENLISGFRLKKIEYLYRDAFRTRPVRGVYHNAEIPGLYVVDKERGNKSDALNCGINVSTSPYFCTVDADSVLEENALIRLATPIIESTVPVIACGGVVRTINGSEVRDGVVKQVELPKSRLAVFQIVEYLRAFLFGRVGYDYIGGILILSGAFSLFNKAAVAAVGGFNNDTVTEDMEIIVRLHKHYKRRGKPYRIRFISDPICWTEVPESLKMLARQRRRWHMGLIQSILLHKTMIFNPKYGHVGLFVMPYYLLVEMLSPAIEVVGYVVVILSFVFGLISIDFFLLFLTLAIFFGVFLSMAGVFLEELTYRRYPKWKHLFRLLAYGALENFGYRQLNSFWRVVALCRYILGKREWEYVRRSRKPDKE